MSLAKLARPEKPSLQPPNTTLKEMAQGLRSKFKAGKPGNKKIQIPADCIIHRAR